MGLAVKLPLAMDENDGAYTLIASYEELALQNLKMLVLTNPGERSMDGFFGVGLKKYLFENNDGTVYSEISAKINEQVARYLSYIEILQVDYQKTEDAVGIEENFLNVIIYFKIIPLDLETSLSIPVSLS